MLSWYEAQSESFVSTGVARENVEAYKASKLTGVVLTDCEGWRQKLDEVSYVFAF